MGRPLTAKARRELLRRPTLIKNKAYTPPEYADFIQQMVAAASHNHVNQFLDNIKLDSLRMLLFAYPLNAELPEYLYNFARNNDTEFIQTLDEFLEQYPNKQLAYKMYCYKVSRDSSIKVAHTTAEIVEKFKTYPTAVNRAIHAIGNMISSKEFLEIVAQKCGVDAPKNNTLKYEEVKELLYSYFLCPSRRFETTLAKTNSVRYMLYLYRNSTKEFTETAYNQYLDEEKGRKALDLQLSLIFDKDDETKDAVSQYLGIHCDPKTVKAIVTDSYSKSATTLRRKIDYALSNLKPQIVIN